MKGLLNPQENDKTQRVRTPAPITSHAGFGNAVPSWDAAPPTPKHEKNKSSRSNLSQKSNSNGRGKQD